MKHLYSLLFLLAITAGNVLAQRNANLELLTTIGNPDTFLYNSVANGGAKTGHIVTYGIINHGPNNVMQTDTIKMLINYNGYPTPSTITKKNLSLSFSSSVPGIAVGDTVYYQDTFYFSAAYGANLYLWCDSMWGKTQGGNPSWNDASLTDNRQCRSIRFLQDPASVEDITGTSKKAFNVYPNPASTTINLAFDFGFSPVTAFVTIKDITGKTVYFEDMGNNVSGKKIYSIDISKFSSGLYLVELYANGEKNVAKVNVLQ